jgi:hypothetical protein
MRAKTSRNYYDHLAWLYGYAGPADGSIAA